MQAGINPLHDSVLRLFMPILSLVVRHTDFEESGCVMPAQAGIQGEHPPASSDAAWIPAFAGMTWLRLSHHLHCGGLLVFSLHSVPPHCDTGRHGMRPHFSRLFL